MPFCFIRYYKLNQSNGIRYYPHTCRRRSRNLSISRRIISCGMEVISWRIASLRCLIDWRRLLYFWHEISPEKKLQGFKSGERAGQPMSPRNEIKWPGNISLKIPIARRKVWAVALSCWSQTLSISWSVFNFGLRKISSISRYRSEFTVTVTLSSSKKYGPHIPNSATAHHTVTRGQCKGRLCNSRGLFAAQYLKFCVFTALHGWKCASSLNNTTAAKGTCCWISKHNALRVSVSLLLSFCANIILYGCIWKSLWRILRKLLSENLRAWARLHVERCGDCWTEALTTATFSGVLAVRGLPVDFRFNAYPVSLKFLTHTKIVFRAGTGSCLPSLKCTRNAFCVAVTDSFVLIKVSTVKARCSPVQFMVSTKLLKILIKSPVQLMVSAEKEKKTKWHYMYFSKIKTLYYVFTLFAFYLTYKCVRSFWRIL